jgi:hypothetical protein
MTFNEWKNSIIGNPLLVLPSSIKDKKGQCFDVAVSWTDNLGIPHFTGNPSPFPYSLAYEIYTFYGSWQTQYFDRIANGLFNAPKEGDIVILRPNHVVVATGNNTFWTFEALSQNYGSQPNIVTIMNFPYNYGLSNAIYGWLRPKVFSQSSNADQYVNAAKDAIISARNNVNTGSQVGDIEFKTKMSLVKQKSQEIISLIDNAK